MLSIYSACQTENPTRNHFGLTGVWSRVRSHMGSAYFSLPSVGGAEPNMHKAQCRGQPVCVHLGNLYLREECTEASYLQLVVSPKKIWTDGGERRQHSRCRCIW